MYIVFRYISVGHNCLFITPNVHIVYGSNVFLALGSNRRGHSSYDVGTTGLQDTGQEVRTDDKRFTMNRLGVCTS